MGEQRFSKIKKTVIILLAVFLVISLTAASASAWYSKTSNDKCKSNLHEKVAKEKVVKEKVAKEKVVKKVAKEKVVKEVAREKVDNRVFDNRVSYSAANDCFGCGWGGFDYGCRDDFREKFKVKYFNIRGCVAGCKDNGFDWWDY